LFEAGLGDCSSRKNLVNGPRRLLLFRSLVFGSLPLPFRRLPVFKSLIKTSCAWLVAMLLVFAARNPDFIACYRISNLIWNGFTLTSNYMADT
jgi:hypothetical protein